MLTQRSGILTFDCDDTVSDLTILTEITFVKLIKNSLCVHGINFRELGQKLRKSQEFLPVKALSSIEMIEGRLVKCFRC